MKKFWRKPKIKKIFFFWKLVLHVMKRKSSVSRPKTPLYVVMILITLIAFVFLVRELGSNDYFESARLDGEYQGTFTFAEQPQILINITFDGVGAIDGSIILNNETIEFNDNSYLCHSNELQFWLFFSDSEFSFRGLGIISPDDQLLSGNIEYQQSVDNSINGTFYLSKLN